MELMQYRRSVSQKKPSKLWYTTDDFYKACEVGCCVGKEVGGLEIPVRVEMSELCIAQVALVALNTEISVF